MYGITWVVGECDGSISIIRSSPTTVPLQKKSKTRNVIFPWIYNFLFFFKKWDCGNGIIEIMGHGLSESNLLLTKVIRSLQRFIRKREKERVGGPELGGCQNHAASGPQSLRWSRV